MNVSLQHSQCLLERMLFRIVSLYSRLSLYHHQTANYLEDLIFCKVHKREERKSFRIAIRKISYTKSGKMKGIKTKRHKTPEIIEILNNSYRPQNLVKLTCKYLNKCKTRWKDIKAGTESLWPSLGQLLKYETTICTSFMQSFRN